MQTLLQILTAVLGADHDLVTRLTEAKPADETIKIVDDDTVNEALAEFVELSDEDITAVQAALRDAAADDNTPADQIPGMVEQFERLAAVLATRAEIDAAVKAEREEALAKMALPEPAEEVAEEEAEEAAPVSETAETPGEETPAEDAPVEEPVMASTPIQPPPISRMANRVRKPAQPLPTEDSVQHALDTERRFTLLDGSASAKFERGDMLTLDEVTEAIIDRGIQMSSGGGGTREQYKVAGQRWDYGEDRTLGSDPDRNEEIITAGIDALTAGFYAGDAAMVAAVCAPPTPLYDIPTVATNARPATAFLPSYQANRGGVLFRPGISFGSAGTVNNSDSGVSGPWTDGDSNKVVLSVTCPSTETATVQAIVARAEVSNMQGRFDPESVAARLRIQDAFWARVAENNVLNTIETNSTSIGPDITLIIGFARQFLQSINTAAAGIRNRERMDPNAMLDLLAPAWIVNAIQDDLSFEQPGAAEERLATTQAQIEDWLRVRNIRVGWFLDGDFTFAAQTAGAALTDYPQDAEMYLFEPGHHLFLDGGELNLGIIRDSTLNNTNEYQTFYETFEAVASRGVVSYGLGINVCRTGTTGAAAEITCGEVS